MKLHVIHFYQDLDLPESVRATLPDAVSVAVLRHALNQYLAEGRSEMHAYARAYANLEKAGYVYDETAKRWVEVQTTEKAEPSVSDVHVNRPLGAVTPKDEDEESSSIKKEDTVTVDIPLLIKLLELAREDIKSDEPLHFIAERAIKLMESRKSLTMDDYTALIADAVKKENPYPAWIGVDFDGTLAEYDGYKGGAHTGKPVPEMVARVKAWLEDGKPVKIFTARVADDPSGVNANAIRQWCKNVFGRELEITAVKDPGMTEFWDDKAVGIERNTGIEKAALYLPPKEVREACIYALTTGQSIDGITEKLANGEGVAEACVRKINGHFESSEDGAVIKANPDTLCNAWGGLLAAKWTERVLRKIERDRETTQKADDEDGEWITVNGQHVKINDRGEVIGGNKQVFGPVLTIPEISRSDRAKLARVACGKDKQQLADKQEEIVAKALGLPRTGDNSAFDLNNGKVGIEIKCMQDSKNSKITMSRVAMDRKLGEAARTKMKVYTVVADKRTGGNTRYYVAKGVGSFRIRAMMPVTLSRLREIVRGA